MSQLFKFVSPSVVIRRNLGKCKFNWFGEGIQYPGFKYYPRDPDFEDPPYEPTKLFRIERIKPLKGVPYFQKDILKEFRLDGKLHCYSIIKNIPENNHRLWKVKHLVKILPITFPDGFPKESDTTVLKENGELRVVKRVEALEEKLQLADEFKKNVIKMDGDTLRRQSRLKWLSGWEC